MSRAATLRHTCSMPKLAARPRERERQTPKLSHNTRRLVPWTFTSRTSRSSARATVRASSNVICSSYLNLPNASTSQSQACISGPTSGKPSRSAHRNSLGKGRSDSPGKCGIVTVRGSLMTSRSPSGSTARRLGAHSSGLSRRYLQHSLHCPISFTSFWGLWALQMPQPVLEASTANTEELQGHLRSTPSTGRRPAATPHSNLADFHRGWGTSYESRTKE